MNTDIKPFLQEGIACYGEARSTLVTFEQQMKKMIQDTLHARATWSPLKNHQITSAAVGGDNDGYWIYAVVKGSSPRREPTEIDCGLWWSSPQGASPIIYANFYFKPERVMAFKWNKKTHGVRSFSAWKRTFLYLPLLAVSDIEPGLNKVLNALLEQLK